MFVEKEEKQNIRKHCRGDLAQENTPISKAKFIRKNLKDQIFGRLTVIKLLGCNIYCSTVWECLCKCGKVCRASSRDLLKNRKQSCGCLNIEHVFKTLQKHQRTHLLNPDDRLTIRVLKDYKTHAKKRNYKFELTFQEFKNLIFKNCYYCGSKPIGRHSKLKHSEQVFYNGIDRVNNNMGYSLSNCVPCCKICNKMKVNLIVEVFINHIKQIILNYETRIK